MIFILYSFRGRIVREFRIHFSSFADVQSFVDLATHYSFPIVVGNDTYRVNGTSFMGMFSLDYSKPLTVMLDCSEEEAQRFYQAAARYIT